MNKKTNQDFKETCGYVYSATGKEYVLEALNSIASLYEIDPDANVVLNLDHDGYDFDFDSRIQLKILPDVKYPKQAKIISIANAPFDKAIFVDTDTLFIGSTNSVFETLSKFDLAVCFAPIKNLTKDKRVADPIECYSGYNSGFIGVNLKRRKVVDFLRNWEKQYAIDYQVNQMDQYSFNQLLYDSDLRILTLPQEYNFRMDLISSISHLGMSVKLVHSRRFTRLDAKERSVFLKSLKKRHSVTFFRSPLGFQIVHQNGMNAFSVRQFASPIMRKNPLRSIILSDAWSSTVSKSRLIKRVIKSLENNIGNPKIAVLGSPAAPVPLNDLINRRATETAIVAASIDQNQYDKKPNVTIIQARFGAIKEKKLLILVISFLSDALLWFFSFFRILFRFRIYRWFLGKLKYLQAYRRQSLNYAALLDKMKWERSDLVFVDQKKNPFQMLKDISECVVRGVSRPPLVLIFQDKNMSAKQKRDVLLMLKDVGYAVHEEPYPSGALAVHKASAKAEFKIR